MSTLHLSSRSTRVGKFTCKRQPCSRSGWKHAEREDASCSAYVEDDVLESICAAQQRSHEAVRMPRVAEDGRQRVLEMIRRA